MAAIATIEHYTAVLGTWIVDAEMAGADPAMVDLLRWLATSPGVLAGVRAST